MSEINKMAPPMMVYHQRSKKRIASTIYGVRETCTECDQPFWRWPQRADTVCAKCLWKATAAQRHKMWGKE